MLAASFIDIDEKIIPDEITVTGTLLGLLLATLVPMSLLPHVAERRAGSRRRQCTAGAAGWCVRLLASNGDPVWLEPVTAVAPNEWPPDVGRAAAWQSLAIGLACYWLWCFALAPRIWRGRRGPVFALRLIASRLSREFARPPLRLLFVAGTPGDRLRVGVWRARLGRACSRRSSASSASGGIVWAVRLIGTASLRREAMGFGDVTLMMMIGTFLGWQACLIAFFLVAVCRRWWSASSQFILRRDDVIPYGPFLAWRRRRSSSLGRRSGSGPSRFSASRGSCRRCSSSAWCCWA